jgi:glycerophosphoryl diester phosphodiesterase
MTVPRVIAHRGSSAAFPDNSWAAFEAAVRDGADAIECDVVATRDGTLVLRHDLSVAGRPVRELTAVEVETLDQRCVRLADLLSWAPRVRIDLLVEIKEPDIALAAARMIAASPWRDHVTVGGFHAPALAAIKANLPGTRTSFMMGSVMATEQLVQAARACRADGIHLCWDGRATYPHRLIAAATIGELRRAGLDVTLWHEEREDELRQLVALGPDAICSDTPAVLRRIVDAYAAHSKAIT